MKKCGILIFCALFCVSMTACSTKQPPAAASSAASSPPSLETTEAAAESTTTTAKTTKEETTTTRSSVSDDTHWTTTNAPTAAPTEPTDTQEMSKDELYNLYTAALAVSNYSDNTLWSQGARLLVGGQEWITQFKQNRYRQNLTLWLKSTWPLEGVQAVQEAYFDGSTAALRLQSPDELLNIRYPSSLEQFAADFLNSGGADEGGDPILFFGAENIVSFKATMVSSEIELVIYADPSYATPFFTDILKNATGASSVSIKKVDGYYYTLRFDAETGIIRIMKGNFYGTCVVDGQEKPMSYEMHNECLLVTGPLVQPDWVSSEIGERPEWMG